MNLFVLMIDLDLQEKYNDLSFQFKTIFADPRSYASFPMTEGRQRYPFMKGITSQGKR